jgi:ATP-dependent RNA helicase DDX23/PRP28
LGLDRRHFTDHQLAWCSVSALEYTTRYNRTDHDVSDTNPLFTTKTEFRPVFGRGFFGGIDPSEQLKKFKEGLEHEKDSKKLRQKETEREDLDKKIKKYQGDLVPAKHWSDKSTSEMTQRDWRIFREDHNISTKGGGIPVPIRSWDEANLPGWLKEAIADAKYKKPTAIQMQSIPIGLQRRDIIGVAETGSGKTAAFLIPMLVYISSLPAATDTDGPYALVMAPTRELAIQIENEAAKFAKHFRIRTACLVGGQSIEEQGLQLRKGVEIVIATPGRLVDCLENHYLVLSVCNYVVLDEADR